MRSSIRPLQVEDSLDQSPLSGTRLGGNFANSAATSSSIVDTLSKHNKRNPPQDCPRIPAVAGAVSVRADQAARFIEPQGRGRHAAAARDFGNGKLFAPGRQIRLSQNSSPFRLT